MKNFLKFLARFSFLLVLGSCVSRVEKHGYMFDLTDYNLVRSGVTNKDRVAGIMGSPTLVSNHGGDDVWIYYAEDVKHFLFFQPTIVGRKVLTLSFDQNNIVRELETIDLTNEDVDLKFAENKTQVNDHQRGLLKSFFSNVGQVKPIQ